MDIIGTIAFAFSGAMIAIRKGMDIFGVTILAITTAVGGGMIRDVLIGHVPPEMFRNPLYTIIAVVTANICFWFLYFKKKNVPKNWVNLYEKTLFLFDTLGLASFTINGVNAGMKTDMADNLFLEHHPDRRRRELGCLVGPGPGLRARSRAGDGQHLRL